MLSLLIQAIGKTQEDPSFLAIRKHLRGYSCTTLGDNSVLNSQKDGLTLTFNEKDVLIKIEMAVHKKWYQLFINQFGGSPQQSIHEACIIHNLGPPTLRMNYPLLMGAQKQILYNKDQYWLSLKFKNEQLESISLLLSCLIAENIKKNYVPIRTCKNKN